MNMSLNTVKAIVNIPLRELESGEQSVIECDRTDLLSMVIYKMRHEKGFVVLREKMELTIEERLVLEHEDTLQRIRDKISYLFINHVYGMGYFQMSPERHRYKQLQLLLKYEEPRMVTTSIPLTCKGCEKPIAEGTRALKTRAGICCNYNCFGLMLAAAKQTHGS